MLGANLAVGVEEDAYRSSNLSVSGLNGSNMVSSTSFSRSEFPSTFENSMDGTAFCLTTATAFDYFLTF